MTKSEQSIRQTLQLIVDILSFDAPDEALKRNLTAMPDWDKVVIIASKHLVLPAVYCRLQQKSMLDILPEELIAYLETLTQLNRERNQTLLEEAQMLSQLFRTHNIHHVFLKGIALLAGNYYTDLGERMIGDIDILVAPNDLDRAFDLLVNAGYSQFVPFNYQVKNYRHRPRQISENHLGAVELHGELLKHTHQHLLDKNQVLEKAITQNTISMPTPEHLIWNTILAQQINDRTYYYHRIQLKGIYDVLVVGLAQKKRMLESLSRQPYGLGFLTIASVFSPALSPTRETKRSKYHQLMFKKSLEHPKVGRSIYQLKWVVMALKERLELLFFNKSYRKHVLKNKLIK